MPLTDYELADMAYVLERIELGTSGLVQDPTRPLRRVQLHRVLRRGPE